ncbi:MAG TPA: luciferase family protein [Bacteroidota bacterium]
MEKIVNEVCAWPGVVAQAHRYGGIEFRLGKRELGHLHGASLLDVPFPLRVKKELLAAGEAEEHHVLPESGWVSFRIRSQADGEHAVDLLRRSFEIATESQIKKTKNILVTTLKEQQA